MVLGAVVVAVGIGAVLTTTATPKYAARVTFFVTTPSSGVTDAYQGGLFSQQRVKSYATLLTGERLAASVAQDQSIGLTAAQIQARTTARAVPDSVLLDASVTDERPERAQRLAAALATRFTELVRDLETPPGRTDSSVKVEVVAGPVVGAEPVSPRPERTYPIAVLLALLAGVGGAVLRELLDTTVKSGDALAEVAGAPTLGVVPFDPGARREPLVAHARSARAEAFRQLRTNLRFADVDNPVRVVAVTSAVAEEGKSTTAVNLALSFAEAGDRVLLIEADLRRPRVAEYLGIEGAAGLSNVLAGQVTAEDVVQPWGDRGLSVMPSGTVPPNPSELLGSAAMSTLVEEQRARYDIVVIDTPPLLPVTDAAVVSVKVDGAVMVVRSGRTGGADVARAVNALRTVDARVLGCVLSMHPVAGEASYYYGAPEQNRRARAAVARQKPAPNGDELSAVR